MDQRKDQTIDRCPPDALARVAGRRLELTVRTYQNRTDGNRLKQLTALLSIVVSLLLLAPPPSAAWADEDAPGRLTQRGHALAERMCRQCHAIGKIGRSPHSGAPAFRALDRRVDLDGFADRLRRGLTSGHPDMPTFRFTREDARALTAYLRSIEAQ